jgi:23S rRNA (cytosine1962-C5)-methyltransferase
VLAVDTSQTAVEWAGKNVEANFGGTALGNTCRFECAPIEDVLRRGERYNVVCLDPPALAKTRSQAAKALDLYQAINRDAMKALEPGGFLITSSCSQPVDVDAFLEMLKRAARSAKRRITLLAAKGAPPDHPVLLAMPETSYLKCVLLQVK